MRERSAPMVLDYSRCPYVMFEDSVLMSSNGIPVFG